MANKRYYRDVYEIEHSGDRDREMYRLQKAGAIEIRVEECNYDAEYCTFSYELPANLSFEDFKAAYQKTEDED